MMFTIKIIRGETPTPPVDKDQQRMDEMLVLTKILDINTQTNGDIIKSAQKRLEKLLDELH